MDVVWDSDTSSNSSLEEVIDIAEDIERPRQFFPRPLAFELYGDNEFRKRFRLTKHTVQVLTNLLQEELRRETARNFPLTPAEQILMTLRFYATGSFQILVGDCAGVHKSTVCRTVKDVSRRIARLRPQFVKMPATEVELRETKMHFHAVRGFPNVVGCIDGSHIKILSPGGNNAELFRNRKGYFSINVQCVCNAKLMFTDIDARWPGSTHDSTMFNASHLCARFADAEFGEGFLLGDSAYALTEHMMTPLLNPLTPPENNYNAAHIQTRNTIERSFGVWKRRFACLSLGLRTKMDNTLTIIVATAVLHNIAVLEGEIEIEGELNEDMEQVVNNIENRRGNVIRQTIINNYFT